MNTQYLQFMNNTAMKDALRNSSVSVEDANCRAREYSKMFSRNDELVSLLGGSGGLMQKTFSGYAESPLLSTQYFNASVASYVSSFAGFMSVERDFDQPNGIFYWFDVLGVTDNRSVVPNMGPDGYQDIQSMGGFTHNVTVQNTPTVDYTSLLGRKLIPGTLRVKVRTATESWEMIDNGQGALMSVAGKITKGTVNYLNGKVDFTLATALTAAPQESITIVGKEDVVGTPSGATGALNTHANDKRFIAKQQQLPLGTVPDMLVAEYNIAALGAMKKATGTDMATFLFTRLRELYTKMINFKLVSTLEEGYQGNTMSDLDLTTSTMSSTFHDYRSRIDLFDAYLINVETALATKAAKGTSTTCYLAGAQAANQFQKNSTKFEKNTKMTYINDLLGWYGGVPVLRSADIKENDGEGTFYALHKTTCGNMAPVARGIYMPLTDTPTVGNYNNPTQMASGIYYQEGTKVMAPELAQRVTFKFGI